MKIEFFTNEYPPKIYGGAGVHVEYLSKELLKLADIEKIYVRCFADAKALVEQRPAYFDEYKDKLEVHGTNKHDFSSSGVDRKLLGVFDTLARDIDFCASNTRADLVHCHTWYSHFAGILAKKLHGLPLAITSHSLEPMRPWKREQLAGGYDFSSWVEKTALEMADVVFAVSESMKEDLLRFYEIKTQRVRVVYNGIDIDEFQKQSDQRVAKTLRKYKIDTNKPYALFLGRIARQKGITHLLRAARHLDEPRQLVICASSPDTPEIEAEVEREAAALRAFRHEKYGEENFVWIKKLISNAEKIDLYSAASVFICPSIYEPFGIINLEAMACHTPVVASAVGGIVEIIEDGKSGILLPIKIADEKNFIIAEADKYEKNLASQIDILMSDEKKRSRLADNALKRVREKFSWRAAARRTADIYAEIIETHKNK